jgi:diadenosine tetraphosphate (Ap4A) HIT family hydrolase
MLIAQTDNFTLESHPKPEVSRVDGGHLVINPKIVTRDRTDLPVEQVIELALLTNLAGKAFTAGMAERGIRLGRINYQDNGNWRQELHVHLYGRAVDATYQAYGEPIKASRRPEDKVPQEPLNEDDVAAIRQYALRFAKASGYSELNIN